MALAPGVQVRFTVPARNPATEVRLLGIPKGGKGVGVGIGVGVGVGVSVGVGVGVGIGVGVGVGVNVGR